MLIMIEIKDKNGGLKLSTVIGDGSIRRCTLMKEDYVTLVFSTDEPVYFKLGDGIDNEWGMFELVDLYSPSYNESTGGYDYQLRLDAYYWKWKNKIFKYTPENHGQEASWSLTATLDVHLGVFLRNLQALGYKYRNTPFSFEIGNTVENASQLITYENTNLIDALNMMAETWDCEWWVTDSVIHFGKCEYGDPVKLELGVEVETMTREGNNQKFATRIYAFGSTNNIPSDYRPIDESVVVNGVVQKRLMLPEGTPYLDAYENMTQEEAVEDVVIFDDVYPRRIGTLSDITTQEYTDTIENEDGTTTEEKWLAYRFKDTGINFSKEYILPGQELQITFQSGKLNGLTFGVIFNPTLEGEEEKPEKLPDGSWNPEAQLWEIVRNEDYGRPLPGGELIPANGDTYYLTGFNIQLVSDQYIPEAEEELKEKAQKYLDKTKTDPNTYNCTLRPDYVYNKDMEEEVVLRTFELGDKINLVNPTFFSNGRVSRVIGYERKLDIPYDHPVYFVGEVASTSRIGELEDKVDALTYKGQTFTGNGSGVYVVGRYDSTPLSDRNVLSSLKAISTFLRKDMADSMPYLLTLLAGAYFGKYIEGQSGGKINSQGIAELFKIVLRSDLQSDDFTLGALGSGYGLIKKDSTGKSYLEIDKVLVRLKAVFNELEIRKLSYSGGNFIFSPAGMDCTSVEEHDTFYRCFFTADDGEEAVENLFQVDDLVQTREFNIKTGVYENVSNRYFWRRCIAIGTNYIDLSKTDRDQTSDDAPKAGDSLVTIGNKTKPDRQNAIVISVYGEGSPSFVQYNGIDDYTMSGKEGTRISPGNNRFTGDFVIEGGESVSTVINGVKSDLAETKTEFQGKIDTVDSKVEGIQIGVRNLASKTKITNNAGATINGYEYTFSAQNTDGLTLNKDIFELNEEYVLSFRMHVNSGTLVNIGGHQAGFTVNNFEINGGKPGGTWNGGIKGGLDTENLIIAHVRKTSDEGNIGLWIQPNRMAGTLVNVTISEISVVKGNKYVGWSPAPEDLEAAAQEAKDLADAAQAAADAADAKADNAQTAADAAKDRLDDWAADSVISPTEKQGLKDEIARIDGDKSEITANYTKYGLGTPTAYNTAHSNYRAVLVSLSAATPETIAIPSDFSTKQSAYYTARTNALTAIAAAAKTAADNAQDAADAAQGAADNAMDKALEAGDKIDNLKIGTKNLVSRKMMLKWNEKNSNIAVWGQDDNGVYLGINHALLHENISGNSNTNPKDIFLGEGSYKANTQYVLSVEWRLAAVQTAQGLDFYVNYTDGTQSHVRIEKYQNTKTRSDLITAKGKTIQKIWSTYGVSQHRTLIYALSLVEGNTPPVEIPTAEEDIWRSEVNLVDGGEEVTTPVVTSSEYNYKELIVPVLKPNTVYTVSVKDIEVLAGSPEGFDATIYFQSPWLKVANWLTLSSGKKYGLLITTNDFSAGEGRLLLYSGIAGATAGNSVRYTGISLVEGFYPPTAWRPSQGDLDKEIQEVSNALTNLDTTINGAFKDGIINEAEAKAIASNINILNAEKKDVDAQYTELYGNPYLTGTAKTNLQSAKTAYNTAHTNLINAINTAISDKEVTAAEKSDVDSKFTAYGTALGTYKTRVEEANKAIQDELNRQAQEKVDEEAELAKWRAIGYSWAGGKPLWGDDPTFKEGINGFRVYDNAGSGSVKFTREAKQSDSPVSDSEYNLKIVCSGGGTPNNGGFLRNLLTRANAVFVFRFIAKLPEGTGFDFNYNNFGTEGTYRWVTPINGTGRFEEYICVAKCGATGSFSTIGYFSIWGTAPVTCYLAYAGAFDVTAGVSTGEQLQTVSGTVTTLSSELTNTKEAFESYKGEVESKFTAAATATEDQIENAVLNLQKGMRNLVKQGLYNIVGSTGYYIKAVLLTKELVPGSVYTIVLKATILGTQSLYIIDNYGSYGQIRVYPADLVNGIFVGSFEYAPDSRVTNHSQLSIYNYPSSGAAANPMDLEWVCLYEGDITDTAPDYFVNAPEDLNLEINSVTERVSAIEQDAESITLRVSATETKVDEAQEAADNANNKVDNLQIGVRNLLLKSNVELSNANYYIGGYVFSEKPVKRKEYTLTLCYTLGENNTYIGAYPINGSSNADFKKKGEKVVEQKTFTIGEDVTVYGTLGFYQFPQGTYGSKVHWAVLVEGNKAPNMWVAAPEDMATKVELESEIEMLEKAINLRVTKTDYDANNVALNQQIGQLETSYNSINGTVSSLNTRLGVLEESGFIVQDDFVTLFSQQLSESGDLIASYLNLTPDKVTLGTDTLEFNADKVKFVSENGLIKLFDGTNVINVNNGKFLVKNTGELNINNGVFKVTNTGAMTATNANITGTVTATILKATQGGQIGGFEISGTVLRTTNKQIVGGNTYYYGLTLTSQLMRYLDDDDNVVFIGAHPDETVGGKRKLGTFMLDGGDYTSMSSGDSVALICAAPTTATITGKSVALWVNGVSVLRGIDLINRLGTRSGTVTVTPNDSVMCISGDVTLSADSNLKYLCDDGFVHAVLIINTSNSKRFVRGLRNGNSATILGYWSKLFCYTQGYWYGPSDEY